MSFIKNSKVKLLIFGKILKFNFTIQELICFSLSILKNPSTS